MIETKSVSKHMAVMIEFLILILLDMQAIDLAPTSFSPSSPPIQLPYSFELDVATVKLHKRIADNVESCTISKKKWQLSRYEFCVNDVLWECFFRILVITQKVCVRCKTFLSVSKPIAFRK
jgi:hypothetical protein